MRLRFFGCKKFFGPQKVAFLKNPNSTIWLNIGDGSHNFPGHPDPIQNAASLFWLTLVFQDRPPSGYRYGQDRPYL